MEYNNNLNISLGFVAKYEVNRLLKLYAYLFTIFSIFSLINVFIDISVFEMIFTVSVLVIPLIYSVVLYYVISSRKVDFRFNIKVSQIILIVLMIFVFFYLKQIIYLILFPNYGVDRFSNLQQLIQYEIIYSSCFSFLINYFILKKVNLKVKTNIFLFLGAFTFFLWIFELISLNNLLTWIIYAVIGIFIYIYTIFY